MMSHGLITHDLEVLVTLCSIWWFISRSETLFQRWFKWWRIGGVLFVLEHGVDERVKESVFVRISVPALLVSPSSLPFRLITRGTWLICLQAPACAEQFGMWWVWLLMEAADRDWCVRRSAARWPNEVNPHHTRVLSFQEGTVLPGQPASWQYYQSVFSSGEQKCSGLLSDHVGTLWSFHLSPWTHLVEWSLWHHVWRSDMLVHYVAQLLPYDS